MMVFQFWVSAGKFTIIYKYIYNFIIFYIYVIYNALLIMLCSEMCFYHILCLFLKK